MQHLPRVAWVTIQNNDRGCRNSKIASSEGDFQSGQRPPSKAMQVTENKTRITRRATAGSESMRFARLLVAIRPTFRVHLFMTADAIANLRLQ
jgi:hypothetical protein